MDRPPRIVRCPKCHSLLQEPPPGIPLYKCGNCSTILRAKHSSTNSQNYKKPLSRRHHDNRPTLSEIEKCIADKTDGRKSPVSDGSQGSKSHDDANLEDYNELRRRHKHGPSPADPVTEQRAVEDQRKGIVNVTDSKRLNASNIEDAHDGLKSPADRATVAAILDDRRKVPPDPYSGTRQMNATRNSSRKSSPPHASRDVALIGEKVPAESSDEDFPVKAFGSQRSTGPFYKLNEMSNTGQTSSSSLLKSRGGLYQRRDSSEESMEVLGRQVSDLVLKDNADGAQHNQLGPGPSDSSFGEQEQGMNRRLNSADVVVNESSFESDPYGSHRGQLIAMRQSSVDLPNNLTILSEAWKGTKLPPSGVGKGETRKDPFMARAGQVVDRQDLTEEIIETSGKEFTKHYSSDRDRQSQLSIDETPLEELITEQSLPNVGDISSFKWEQENRAKIGGRREEELINIEKPKKFLYKYTSFEDEETPGVLLEGQITESQVNTETLLPPASLPLSPPSSFTLPPKMSSNNGRIRPFAEHLPKAQASSQRDSVDSQVPHDMYGPPDVLNYDTSEDSSNMDETDPYQNSIPSTSRPHSEELELDQKERERPTVFSATDVQFIGDESEQPEASASFASSKPNICAHPSPWRSPESTHSADSCEGQKCHPVKLQEMTSILQSGASESSNSFSFDQGSKQQGENYVPAEGQVQPLRLLINAPIPERIHVKCKHCKLHLEVPLDLPPSETGRQKLRCGSCWKVSRFRLDHLLLPTETSSPAASDFSGGSSFQFGPNSPDNSSASKRYSGTRSNRETGIHDRLVIRTNSGATLPVPPSARHNPRAASASKLSNMTTAAGLPSGTSGGSTPRTSVDLGPSASSSKGVTESVEKPSYESLFGQDEPSYTSLSPALSNASEERSTDELQRATQDRNLLHSSSESDEEIFSTSVNVDPVGTPSTRMKASASDPPEIDDGHGGKGRRNFFKFSLVDLTKGKKSNQYRRKVVVNNTNVPDDVVRRAEEYAGPIHPGSYWYDIRAGFWGVMGGPCLGMIPPFIEEFQNYPLARHCSHGKTGVLVNGRELHNKDLELLKKRGLPGTPGKSYNVDIDGRLIEVATGHELPGLGRLAPTLEQTGRGPGMWVPVGIKG